MGIMGIMGIIIVLLVVFLLIYMWSYYQINPVIVFILKMITSFLFVLLGIVAYIEGSKSNDNYSVLVITGLICGFFGDYILGLKRINRQKDHEYMILGMVMFLIGHIVYTIAFATFLNFKFYIVVIIAILLTALIILLFKLFKIDFKREKWSCYIYILLSLILGTITVSNLIFNHNLNNLMIGIGAISFILSDFLLCFVYFKKLSKLRLSFTKYANIIFYYLGQTLFALSLYYLV